VSVKENKMIGFVYIWKNLINGKKYIGVHLGTEDDGYVGSGVYFRNAVKKYGIENFERSILYREYISKENLYLMEFEIINDFNAVFDNEYYNLANYSPMQNFDISNSSHSRTRVSLESTRNKISESRKNRKWIHKYVNDMKILKSVFNPELFLNEGWTIGFGKFSEEHSKKLSEKAKKQIGEKNGFYGKSHSEETRKKLSEKAKKQIGEKNGFYGKSHSEETRKKLSEKAKKQIGEKNGFYGKSHSEETRKKLSEKNSGTIFINDGANNKTIQMKELENYEKMGWIRGRITKNSQKGKIKITNDEHTIVISKDELDKYISKGYRRGTKNK
jgi:hypothetical protein